LHTSQNGNGIVVPFIITYVIVHTKYNKLATIPYFTVGDDTRISAKE
jgi:hypothetical protein